MLVEGTPVSGIEQLSIVEIMSLAQEKRGQGNVAAAIEVYRTWVAGNAANPLLYAVMFNYAVSLNDGGDLAGAEAAYLEAIRLNPNFFAAYINLGMVYERMGARDRAVLQWYALVSLLHQVTGDAIGHKLEVMKQLARVLSAAGISEKAEEILRFSLDIRAEQPEVVLHLLNTRQSSCQWPVVSPWGAITRRHLMSYMAPLGLAMYSDDPMLQLAGAYIFSALETPEPAEFWVTEDFRAPERGPLERGLASRGQRRLRIGYLSSDLRAHAVGFFMAEIFGLHNRDAVEIFVYYTGIPAEDALKVGIRAESEHWHDIARLGDAAAADLIRSHGIDILVDLNGHTRDHRLKLIAMRPAPINANWMGYPGTMGTPYHHYIVADDTIIPPENERYYSEKVVRLPCYQPNDRRRGFGAEAPSRSSVGLPEEGVVYCCFNGVQKLMRFTVERWAKILAAVPGSVLWLLRPDPRAIGALEAVFAAQGVTADRLIYADRTDNPHHVARYKVADVFLDTLPYGAHTTASDSLWMGVPVVTVTGRGFASRVCSSLVKAAGVPELVCETPDRYVDLAIRLGLDAGLRQSYRTRLETNRATSTLFDSPSLVRHLEQLYAGMWDDFCRDALPQPDLTNLKIYHGIGCDLDHEGTEIGFVEGYEDLYRTPLTRKHRYSPIPSDRRLWGPKG